MLPFVKFTLGNLALLVKKTPLKDASMVDTRVHGLVLKVVPVNTVYNWHSHCLPEKYSAYTFGKCSARHQTCSRTGYFDQGEKVNCVHAYVCVCM